MKTDPSSQPVSIAGTAQFDDEEGGLNLGRVVAAIYRRLWLIGGLTVTLAVAAGYKASTDTPIYTAGFEILTEPLTVETKLISSLPQTLSAREDIVAVTIDETKIKVLKSPRVLTPIVEQLQGEYPDLTYPALAGRLGIQTGGQNILQVTYKHPNSQLVESVLSAVAEAYLEYSREERQTDIRRGIDFVDEQLPRLEARVEELQARLQRLRQRYNLVDPAIQGEQLSNQIGSFGAQQLNTQVEIDEARALYGNLQTELSRSSPDLAAASALKESSTYQSLLAQIQEIDRQIAKDSVLFYEESPDLEILQQQRQQLLDLLRQESDRVQREVANNLEELQEREQALDETVARLNLRVKELSRVTREYNDIQRELQIATDNLNQFLVKREALRIDVAQREVPWQLLSPVSDPKPSSASVKQNLVLGAMLGMLLGIGAALVLDRLGNTIYAVKEVKEVARLPLLGVIPYKKELEVLRERKRDHLKRWLGQPLQFGRSKRRQNEQLAPFFEAFRSLYTNIRLLGSDASVRSLAISSAASAEGKSTVAVHLAQAAAAMGRRVLLVNADLRRPEMRDASNWVGIRGLSEAISTELDFNEVIQRSHLEDNLFILPAGRIPPDPLRLLASQRMQELMRNLHAAFDLTIYDTPPLVGLADAYLIAAQTDGLVLVAGVGTLKRSVLEQALEELRVSGTPALGMVVNKAKDISQDALDWRYRQTSRADSTEARSTQAVESSSYLDGSPRHPD